MSNSGTDSTISQRQILKKCLESYMEGKTDRSETAFCVMDGISLEQLSGDPVVAAAYWAARHLAEEDYWTTDQEIKYLFECLAGEKEYSEEDLNKVISTLGA